jgi:hypothetical protein
MTTTRKLESKKSYIKLLEKYFRFHSENQTKMVLLSLAIATKSNEVGVELATQSRRRPKILP